ncbi:MAG: group III truncated hemoglobin [Halioglobus sp.]
MPKSRRKPDESEPLGVVHDLDSLENIENFVDHFYAKVLRDEMLAPLFLEVAKIDLAVHLPHIKAYWCKLLLGAREYNRHTMNIHRQLHSKQALKAENFERWLLLFVSAVDEKYSGQGAEKAKRIARSIAKNMQSGLSNVSSKVPVSNA